MLRRFIEICITTLTLLTLSPLLIVVAFGIVLETHEWPIFGHPRMGRGGQPFMHYRFRTRTGHPPRYSRFGRFIGNLSLDDIPTLINVLKGDMGFVGPRPESIENVNLNDPLWQQVLQVKPGLLSPSILALLDQYNSSTPTEKLTPELYYIAHRSLAVDLKIIFQTLTKWLKLGHLKGKF